MFYYKNNKTNKYENSDGIIAPSLSIIKTNSNYKLNFQKVVNTDIPAWKYFANKTKFNYLSYNNLDCVINAAITFESYIVYIIKCHNLYEKYKKQCKNQLGFRSALGFCLENNMIDKTFYNRYNDGYEKIGVYRSLIIHGAIDNPIIDRKQAKKAYETIIDIFSTIDSELYKSNDLLSYE
jgi:hypothetical protein